MNGRFVKRNLVWYDGHRWYDAVGPNVAKVLDDFQKSSISLVAGSTSPVTTDGWLMTFVEVGAGGQLASPIDGAQGGQLLLTTAGNEDDGINIQATGEAFSMASSWPLYFGIRFKVSEATQSDFVAGLHFRDATLVAAGDTGAFFRKADGSTACVAVLEKNTAETTGAALTVANDTWMTLEITFDGSAVDFWVDGTKLTRLAQTNLPNDEWLTPSFEFLNGSAASRTVTIDWIKCIQVQA